jgi:hypothetical protein
MDTLRARGIEWHFTCDDPVAFLGELGWSAGCHALTELARRHGREMPADWELGRSYLVAAVRSPEAKRLDLAG